MRICFHTHCFPDGLAPRALGSLAAAAAPYGLVPHTDGTAAGTERVLKGAGIGGALLCSVATNPRQQQKVNDFALSLAGRGGFWFVTGSLHPEAPEPEKELDRLQAAGVRGIKIHPDYMGTDIADPLFDRLFGLMEERGMFCVTHTGFDPASPRQVHATPEGLLAVIRRHPRLTLIAAHMGGPGQGEKVLEMLAGTGIRFDTSLSATRPAERETLIRILRNHDDSRILFGTDSPWSDPAAEIRFLEGSGLSDRALEKIFYRNAAGLLGL